MGHQDERIHQATILSQILELFNDDEEKYLVCEKNYQPELYKNLGIFVPLIVVNCMILGRSEAFAFKNNPLKSLVDGLGMGVGFIIVITILGAIREIFGNGTISLFNTELINLGDNFKPALLFIMPPGGFLTIGFLMALKKKFSKAS